MNRRFQRQNEYQRISRGSDLLIHGYANVRCNRGIYNRDRGSCAPPDIIPFISPDCYEFHWYRRSTVENIARDLEMLK